MEFVGLGSHCEVANCQQLDFLPFQCDMCKKTFCLDHSKYDDHNCEQYYKKNKIVPVCPLCQQVVSVPPGMDPNAMVERHINAGCPRPKTKSSAKCTAPKCQEKGVVTCKYCDEDFCLKHRHEQDHDCIIVTAKSVKNPQSSNSTSSKPVHSTRTTGSNFGTQLGQIYKQREAEKARQGVDTRSGSNSPAIATATATKKAPPKFEFANKKFEPVGNKNIDYQSRFLLDAFYPEETKNRPVHMVFNKDWSVGKVMDFIANHGKMPNNNNSVNITEQQRLHLFNLRTGEMLPNSQTLASLGQDRLKSGDPVYVQRGTELSEDVKAALDQQEEAGCTSSCIIA